jgi:hypothetical protein
VAEVAAVPIDEERTVVFVRLQHEPELCACVFVFLYFFAVFCRVVSVRLAPLIDQPGTGSPLLST